MSDRPDIAAALGPGEQLLWQGQPQPGRRVPVRATIYATLFGLLTAVLLLVSWFLAVWHSDMPNVRAIVFGLIAVAALFTFFALRITLLDQRRARARDRQSAYAITDARALAIAGPYRAEVVLGPGVSVKRAGDTLSIAGNTDSLHFERLDDAREAQNILATLIGEKT